MDMCIWGCMSVSSWDFARYLLGHAWSFHILLLMGESRAVT